MRNLSKSADFIKQIFGRVPIKVSAILVGSLMLVAFLLIDRQEIKTSADEQSIRLEETTEQLRFANKTIVGEYNFDFLAKCNVEFDYLTDNSLDLEVDVKGKSISTKKIKDVLGLDNSSKIRRVIVSQNEAVEDIDFYKSVVIKQEGEVYLIAYEGKHRNARPLDFKILVELTEQQFCIQSMRLFFSEPVDKSGKWKVKSSIGRGGLGMGKFTLPYGTEFHEGRLWTTDCSNENVSVFNLDGRYVDSFSQFGSGLGKFDTPSDMKIFNDKIYIVEERNHRVQVFSMEGEPLFLFGSYKSTNDPHLFTDKFNNPLGISVTDKLIVVVDYGNERILAYDHDFNHMWTSANDEDDSFAWDNPYYIEYSKKHDHFLISNQTNSNIGILSPAGEKIAVFGSDVLVTPFEVAITEGGDAIVADTIKKQVVIFDGEKEYATKHVIPFGENYGIPKTVTALSENEFLVGFVGNGPAYFLQLENTEMTSIALETEGPRPVFKNSEEAAKVAKVEDGPGNPKWVYSTYCASCHEGSIYNAPARGNVEAWDRFPRDLNKLLEMAKVGKGAMISKGGCSECTDAQLLNTIKLLVPKSWDSARYN